MDPLSVSALIVTRNRYRLLMDAIASIDAQTLRPVEVIVVDDASDDDTANELADLAERTDGWITPLRLPARRGPAGALNAGIAAARGDLVAFLGDDDTWLPDKLARQISLFEDPLVDLAFTSIIRETDGRTELVRLDAWRQGRDHVVELLLQGCAIVGSTVVMRRSVIDRVGPFDERLIVCEDWDMWMRLAVEGCGIAYLDEPLTCYRFHAGSLSRNARLVNEGAALLFDKLFSSDALSEHFLRRKAFYLARAELNAASRSLVAGAGNEARRALGRAVRMHPPSIRPGWIRMYLWSFVPGRERTRQKPELRRSAS